MDSKYSKESSVQNSLIRSLKERDVSVYIGVLIGLVVASLGLYLINTNIIMNDAFWHIKTGEWIQKFGIIDKCHGSWVLKDESWMAHEWLFGYLMYFLSKSGMDNILRFFGIMYLLTLTICFIQGGVFKKTEKPPLLYWELILLLQFVVYTVSMTARPQYITAVIIGLFLLILNQSQKSNYKILYILPFLTILWSNLHGGTALLSYLMIVVYLICNIFNWNIGKIQFKRADKNWIIHCGIVLFLSIVAIMVNPYGYKMLTYPYVNMQDDLMISLISEWASPDPKKFGILLFETMPMLLGIISFIQYKGSVKAHDIALFFLYLILYLRSARFYPFLVVIQTCMLTPYAFQIELPKKVKKKKTKMDLKNNRFSNNISIIVLMFGCIIFSFYQIISADYQKIERNKELPDSLIEQVKEQNPNRLLNTYNTGGYLLYNGVDVFVDGRYEPYNQKNVINDYVTIMYPKDRSEHNKIYEIIEKYNFDAFLISTTDVVMADFLDDNNEQYKLSYEDEKWLYYFRIERN